MSDRRRDDDFDMDGADAPMGAKDWGKPAFSSAIQLPEGTPTFRIKSAEDEVVADFHRWKAGPFNPNRAEGEWTGELIFFQHRDIGPAKDTYLCPLKQGKKPCAVCDYAEANRRRFPEGSKELRDFLSDHRAKAQGNYQLTFPEKDDWTPRVWRHAAHNFSNKFKIWFDTKKKKNPDIVYWNTPGPKGMTLSITFQPSDYSPKAFDAISFELTPRNYTYDHTTLSQCLRLEDYLVWPDYEEVASALGGGQIPEGMPSRTSYSQGVQAPSGPPRQSGPRPQDAGTSGPRPSGPPRSSGPQSQPSVPSGPPKGPPRAQQHTPDTDEHDERDEEQSQPPVPAHVADALHPQPGYRFWFKVGDDDQPVSVEVLKVRPDGMCSCEDEDGNPLRIHADVIANLHPDMGVPPAAPEPERKIEPVQNVPPTRRNRKVS